ncbi:MAG: ATP-binding cassette domain-containing protein [Deltaproteobacteria bacterium]|nr:ATP-binding cassette domain-containing protein [Deltaproteobacteria bacterium]
MISVDHLTKRYGPHTAVNDISFSVDKGQVLGFLGPNGAGKSTTMKILTTFLSPTAGRARIAGLDVWDHPLEVRRKIGYLPEDTPLYKDMAIAEYLAFVCEVRKLPRSSRKAAVRRVAEQCGIADVAGKPIGSLSRGYRQRVGLAQALVHEPDVLILDEPTSGLDPNQIVEIRQLIRDIGRDKTVILSTHILPEVNATCGRVIIISDGRLVADGKPDDLMASEKTNRYRVLYASDGGAGGAEAALDEKVVQGKLAALPGVKSATRYDSESKTLGFHVTSDGATDLRRPLFQCAVDEKWPLLELDRMEASLEEVFRRLTRNDADENAAAGAKPGASS